MKSIKVNGFRQFDDDAKDLFRKSYKWDITANQTNENDVKFTHDIYIYGGIYNVVGDINDGDYLEIEVIDKDNVLGLGANTVLSKFVETEYIVANDPHAIILSEQGDNIPAGIYLRARYVSVGSNAPTLVVRYLMRKGA